MIKKQEQKTLKEAFEDAREIAFPEGNEVIKIVDINDSGQLLTKPYFKGASGKVYEIRTADQGVPLKRWNAYEKLQLNMCYGATLEELAANNKKSADMLNRIVLGNSDDKTNAITLLQHLLSINKGLEKSMRSGELNDFSKILYFATIFIIREDEDLSTWDMNMARSKIEDWAKSNIDINSFFVFARYFSEKWATQLENVILG